MRSTLALVQASWRAARSYRLRMVFAFASLIVSVVPLYFVANALQPVMAGSIEAEGGQYFGFLIVGMMTFLILPVAVTSLPGEVSSGIGSGVLEMLLSTRAGLASVLSGLLGYGMLWTLARAVLLLLVGWVLGAQLVWAQLLPALFILGLVLLAYLPVGLLAAALIICFRTAGPLSNGVLLVSSLLGGVYYPTSVIPSWIGVISRWVPLTYGLRALRGTLLEGRGLLDVASDLAVLSGFIVALWMVAVISIRAALRFARREGTLGQY